MIKFSALCLAGACALCVDWTRISGTVKGVNLKASTVTIQTRDGNNFTIPVDYQVSIEEKHGELRSLKSLALDEKVTLTRVPSEPPKEDTEGLAPPETPKHGL